MSYNCHFLSHVVFFLFRTLQLAIFTPSSAQGKHLQIANVLEPSNSPGVRLLFRHTTRKPPQPRPPSAARGPTVDCGRDSRCSAVGQPVPVSRSSHRGVSTYLQTGVMRGGDRYADFSRCAVHGAFHFDPSRRLLKKKSCVIITQGGNPGPRGSKRACVRKCARIFRFDWDEPLSANLTA